MLPDGVTGFGSIFDANFIGSIALVTGELPAEFGMRTVGLVDITTRADIFNNSGTVGVYGGSHGNLTPYAEYGGTFGSNCPTATPAPGTHSLPSIGVIVTDVEEAAGGGILRDAGRLQEHFLDRGVGTFGQRVNSSVTDRVGCRADGRVEVAAPRVERVSLGVELRGRRDGCRRSGRGNVRPPRLRLLLRRADDNLRKLHLRTCGSAKGYECEHR
jgi:hypothetical protein